MKNHSYLILISVILLSFASCTNKKTCEYDIISKRSLYGGITINGREDIPPADCGPASPGYEYYSNLVIVFDSIDRVYLYQTVHEENLIYKKNHPGFPEPPTKYPNFIGLYPYHLMSFSSTYFIQFIKENNDILLLDTTSYGIRRFVFIVSTKDTIENKAYYDLVNLIKPKKHQFGFPGVYFCVRKTTEEENNVIYCKRKKIPYYPLNIQWSKKFINGDYSPFTKGYDSTEMSIHYKIKAQNTFIKDCTLIPHIGPQ